MRRVSRRDANLRVSDGKARVVIVADTHAPDAADALVTHLYAYNIEDALLMLTMMQAMVPQILTTILQQTYERGAREAIDATNGLQLHDSQRGTIHRYSQRGEHGPHVADARTE